MCDETYPLDEQHERNFMLLSYLYPRVCPILSLLREEYRYTILIHTGYRRLWPS